MDMDYKYIEQLLERYFDCETSLEEEAILRTFFHQEELPEELAKYRALFADDSFDAALSPDFDDKVLNAISSCESAEVHKKSGMTIVRTLAPLVRACAIVAIVIVVGALAQFSVGSREQATEVEARALATDDDIMFQVSINDDSLQIINITGDLDEEFIDMMTEYYKR